LSDVVFVEIQQHEARYNATRVVVVDYYYNYYYEHYTVAYKKCQLTSVHIFAKIVTDFKNSITLMFFRKFAIGLK